MYTLKREYLTARVITRIAILGVIGTILMFIKTPLGFMPPFLKLDVSDLPSLLGAFALGPMAGVLVQFVKVVLNLMITSTTTGGVGDLSNFIIGATFSYAAGMIYYKNKNFKGAVIGLAVGIISMVVVASISNYFIIFPLYAKIMPLDKIIETGTMVNSRVVDLKTMIIYCAAPFSVIKGSLTAVLCLALYKRLSPILKA